VSGDRGINDNSNPRICSTRKKEPHFIVAIGETVATKATARKENVDHHYYHHHLYRCGNDYNYHYLWI
jgi:hypothetical protein